MADFVLVQALLLYLLNGQAHAQAEGVSSATISSSNIAIPGETTRARGSFEYGMALQLETTRALDDQAASSLGGSFMVKPTIVFTPLEIAVSFQAAFSQMYDRDGETGELPQGSFDNHVLTIAKAVNLFSYGVTGTLPANQAAIDLTFRGSVGPFAKIEETFGRLTLGQTLFYQRRLFRAPHLDEGPANYADAYKTLSELALRVTDSLGVSSDFQVIYAVSEEGFREHGTRSQVSVDYRPQEKITTSCGWALEHGMSTIDGVSDKTFTSQAFVDLILDI